MTTFAAESISEYLKAENSYYEGVSSESIQLTLSGPDLPTVTLVDLPGMYDTFLLVIPTAADEEQTIWHHQSDMWSCLVLSHSNHRQTPTTYSLNFSLTQIN